MSVCIRLIATLLALAAWLTACSSPSATQEYTPALPATTIAASIATLDPYINMTGLVVAPDGAVWFSLGNSDFHNPIAGGVSRYAQGRLTRFTTDDGLPNANVQALAIAPDGSVWMGGVGCTVARYDGQAWQTVNADCSSIGGNVVDFAFTPNGSVWVATGMDLARFDGRSWTRFGKYASWLAVAPDGTLWAKSWEWEDADLSEYVTRFDGENWTIVDRLPIGRLFLGPDGLVWANLTGGYSEHARLVRFDGQAWEILPGPSSTVLLEFAVAPNGELWAMTDQGFSQYDGATWLYAGVRPQGITRFAFAADGSIWLGGSGSQLAHYQPATARLDFIATPIPTITPNPTLPALPPGPAPSPSVTPIPQLPVTNLVITTDGAVWYSFGALEFHPRRGGIVRLHHGVQTHVMPEANVQLLAVGPDGLLWAGMGCSLARFDGHAWQTILDQCDTLHGNVMDLAFALDGATWVVTGFKLVRFRDGTWTIYDRLANDLAVTPDGALWVSGWEGRQGSQYVARFDGTRFSFVERIATGRLLTGPDGSLWSFQDTGALARFDGQAWRAFGDLPFQRIDDLAFAQDGVLWLATDLGLLRFDGVEWLHDASAPDGITQLAFAPDGSLWLGDFRGQVFLHNPTQVEPLPTATGTPTLDTMADWRKRTTGSPQRG